MAALCHVLASGQECCGTIAVVLHVGRGAGESIGPRADAGFATQIGKDRLLTGWVSAQSLESGRSL